MHLLFDDNRTIDIPLPPATREYEPQNSYDTSDPVDLSQFGETVMAPLGHVVLGRSGTFQF